MKNLYIYHEITGQIRVVATVLTPDPKLQLLEVSTDLDSVTIGTEYYVNQGQLVKIPIQPSLEHQFIYVTKTWEDPRTLQDLKTAKRNEINLASEKANKGFFIFAGQQIACDDTSRSYIDAVNGLVSLTNAMPLNWIGAWKTITNTYVSIPDVVTWTSFYSTMVAAGLNNFNHAQQLKATLDAAITKEEVTAIVW
jgi:hypothetical protein